MRRSNGALGILFICQTRFADDVAIGGFNNIKPFVSLWRDETAVDIDMFNSVHR